MISIVSAAFNEAKVIGTMAETVLAQTFRDFELVIVDDGSSDETVDIVRAWAERDGRVRLVQNERNLGQTPSLNAGIECARGEWVARIDADDLWEPDKLAEQVAHVSAHPDVGLLGTWTKGFNEQTGQTSTAACPESDEEIKRVIWRYCPFVHSAVLVRRSLLDAHGVYDLHYQCAQDYDLWFRLAFHTQCYNVPKTLCKKVTHRDQCLTYERWKQIEREILAIRFKNMRLHGRGPLSYLSLLPTLGKLCLPTGAKRWKQALVRGKLRLARGVKKDA